MMYRLAIAAALLACAAQGEDAPEQPLMDAMVFHTQGWGKLGHGVHAHHDGQTPAKLNIAGKEYPHGLGSHAPQETVFALEGRYLAFDAEVGIQQQPSGQGSVEFIVEVDGREVFRSGILRGDSSAVPVHVDLIGAQELMLKATDAGDGITCDVANWANATLTPDPDAKDAPPAAAIDMAPFARVVTSDPNKKHGSTHKRIEEFPAEELFPEAKPKLVPGDAPGGGDIDLSFESGDAPVAIGLQWLERRRISRLAIHFAGEVPAPGEVQLEEWDGPSRWQGTWHPIDSSPTVEGLKFTYELPRASQAKGALQYRWILPASARPWRLDGFDAWSRSGTGEVELQVEQYDSPLQARGFTLSTYNAELLPASLGYDFHDQFPLQLKVRHVLPRTWQASDRSQLRFACQDHNGNDRTTSIAIDTLLAAGRLYIPSAGLFITSPPGNVTLEQHLAEYKGKKTILERVREMPDQTLEQAMEHITREDAKLGPTLLSLPADNRKFLVERDGSISWSNDPAKYDVFDKAVEQPFDHKLVVKFGGQIPSPQIRRVVGDGRSGVQTRTELDGLIYTSSCTVLNDRNGKVAAAAGFAFSTQSEIKQGSINWTCIADLQTGRLATPRMDGEHAVFEDNGILLVRMFTRGCALEIKGDTLYATAEAETEKAKLVVAYVPRQGQDAHNPSEVVGGREANEQLWEGAFNDSADIYTPNEHLNNIIRASRVHCLLAARNDHQGNIAPWIGSVHYGPLESEGHAVIRGMMALGHQDFARRALNYYVERYNEQGFLTTGYTTMGTGWHLWTLGEYDALYHDDEFLKTIEPEVARVCSWVGDQRAKTRMADRDVDETGLMPPGPLADWDLWAYYFYANGYYAAGLRDMAQAFNRLELHTGKLIHTNEQFFAPGFQELLRNDLQSASAHAPVVPLSNGISVPFYPTHPYAPGPIGDLYPGEDGNRSWCYDVELGAPHLIAMGIIDPHSEAATHMMEYHEDEFYLRDGWFNIYPEEENRKDWFNYGGFAKVQPYYARTGEIHALRDDVKPFLRTYFNSIASLINPEDLSFWEHFFNGAYNKTHETGYFLYQTAQMLAQSRFNPEWEQKELWLAPLIPEAWLAPGSSGLTVERLPTTFGRVSYRIEPGEKEVKVHITPPEREGRVPIVVRLRGVVKPGSTVTTEPADVPVSIEGDTIRITPPQEAFTVSVAR